MESEERPQFSLAEIEKRVLAFWTENDIFKKSVDQRAGATEFVFYEGPPTANGTPGVHHVEARAFKDVILRYKTMRGYQVPRRAGWDTHGLPVELQVEKELGLTNKKEIEAYGIAAFNKKCRESVWKYRELWENLTHRMGFWVDMSRAYVTYANTYIESLWWVIKQFSDKGYLYEDYKVVPWCARCGTALSSHEIAQGYEEVEDESVYVKFKLKAGQKFGNDFVVDDNTFMLAWTTTPWTLPGNVALAVGKGVSYALTKTDSGELFVLAQNRAESLFTGSEIIHALKGENLIGLSYEPIYHIEGFEKKENDYTVIAGDFVSTEDGTGIVHIAPAFGDDDFQVGKKNNLSVLVTTNERGLMETPGYSWHELIFKTREKKDKTANALIKKDLESRGILLKTELYKHDYPFCWRCKNPLMYFTRKTWWVSVNSVRPQLLANNETINWYPDYLKHGRFGGWLKEEKDWAFSRERYWGTPLPVWRCESCNAWETIGGLDDLSARAKPFRNRYIVMRHAHARSNEEHIFNSNITENTFGLTEKGKQQGADAVTQLKKTGVQPDMIFSSPFLRAKETAEIIRQGCGIAEAEVKIEPRLGECGAGIFAGKNPSEYHAFYKDPAEKWVMPPPEGESLRMVAARTWAAFQEMEERYEGKTILLVTHEYPAWAMWAVSQVADNASAMKEKDSRGEDFLDNASFEELHMKSLPRNEEGELDMHKPYIDSITLSCASCSGTMRRVTEVVDVWFDSGAMPYAQDHFPFDQGNADFSKIHYPADYIVEAVDQTRGWFYNLLSVATLLGQPAPYKNVISLGHVLDTKGKKMSKSLGNIVDPGMLIDKYGADSVRWYFFTVNQPWDSKLFDEKDVQDSSRRFFMIFWNSFQFWKLYGDASAGFSAPAPKLVINQWVVANLHKTIGDVTVAIDAYDLVSAARIIENFVVEDLSRWYIRRIRGVVKEETQEADETIEVLRYVLIETCKMIAPFAPFLADEVYRALGGKDMSVHLSEWPDATASTGDEMLLGAMMSARVVVASALEARAKAGVKVRQPLLAASVQHTPFLVAGIEDLIKEEVNIKEIRFNPKQTELVVLDMTITDELREEGRVRDMVRAIQDARKKAGLMPGQLRALVCEGELQDIDVIKKYESQIKSDTSVSSISITEGASFGAIRFE